MRCSTSSPPVTTLATMAGLLAIAMSSGCGWHRAYGINRGCGPCGDAVAVDVGGCETDACGGCDTCGGDIYPGSCGTRATGPCGGLSGFCLPLLSTRLACGSGCGGVYWNEWICDPPECCDPCNDGGCWVGPQSCPPQSCWFPGRLLLGTCRHVRGVVAGAIHLGLHGYRPGYCAGGAASCTTCGLEDCTGCDACSDCGSMGCAGECARANVAAPTLAARGSAGHSRVAARPPARVAQRAAQWAPQPRSSRGVAVGRR